MLIGQTDRLEIPQIKQGKGMNDDGLGLMMSQLLSTQQDRQIVRQYGVIASLQYQMPSNTHSFSHRPNVLEESPECDIE